MSKSKGGKVGFIAILIVLVMLIVAIVGVCLTWITRTSPLGTTSFTLGDLFDVYGDWDNEIGGAFKAMASFAILTVILAAATTILAGICKVLGWKLFRFILVVVAIVCVVCGVVTVITSYTFCDKLFGQDGLLENAPAIGMWLTSIGGALAGLVGIFAAVKS